MRSPRIITPLLLLGLLLLGAAPATKPSLDPQTAAINKAIEDCAREFDAYLRDQAKAIRTESNYFKQNPSPDVTVEAVLKVLERPMGGDPRLQAYVKWQLLSAVPGKFDDALISRAGQAFVRGPAPQPRPGVTVADRQLLMSDLQRNTKKLDDVNERYDKRVADFFAAQEPILNYRTTLFSRLPVTGETIAAGFEDVIVRVEAGADFDKFLDSLLGSARNWSLDEKTTPRQRAALAQLVERVKNTDPPSYYDQAALNSKDVPYWKTKTASKPDKGDRLTAFIQFLRNPN